MGKTIRFRVPKAKPRAGVHPTMKEMSKKKYSRKKLKNAKADWKSGNDND